MLKCIFSNVKPNEINRTKLHLIQKIIFIYYQIQVSSSHNWNANPERLSPFCFIANATVVVLIACNFLKQLYFLAATLAVLKLHFIMLVLKFNFGWFWFKKVKSCWVLVVQCAPRWVPTSIGSVGKFMFMSREICHKRYERRGWIWNSVNNFSCKRILAVWTLFLCCESYSGQAWAQ